VSSAALRYLDARARFGMKFGLETMRALMEELGHPERAWPSLLVAGTNGKGSVVAVVDQVLRDSGLRVGRYTSPHLVRLHERIAVDGRLVTDGALLRAVRRVRDAAEALVRTGRIPAHPTHFEAVTAAAFLHFAARRVDVAVLEVGLGGRLDATNVCDPVASAIVTIARDHEAQLGGSLPAIAREKAGVLRRGRTCVLGALPASARRAIGEAARREGARLRDVAQEGVARETASGLTVRTAARTYRGLHPLTGAHQVGNLRVALALLEEAERAGVRVRWSRVRDAVARTRWPGRLQTLAGRPEVLLDGAHNPEGARALARHLAGGPPFVLVFGAMADKDVPRMARLLFPLAERVVLTSVAQDRAASPRELARRAGAFARGGVLAATPSVAMARARALAGPRGRVVVAGSLFLVGDVLALSRRRASVARRRRRSRRAGS
jgi:dihydrofolate synthase / folylpolyglutamate synthase